MTLRRRAASWHRYLRFWGNDPAGDLDDELRFHLEARYDEYVADGMNRERARAEVDRRFGDLSAVRAQCTEIDTQWQRERSMIDRFHIAATELRYALRQLRRNTSLSIAAILCLALGIGVNTSIFSVVDTVLFRPLPFPQADRLVLIGEALPNFGGGNFGLISTPEYHDYQRLEGRVFESAAIYDNTVLTISSSGADPERVPSAVVSATLFKVLRINAAHGRLFLPGDDVVGSANAAVISDAFWRRRFNADPSVVGRTVLVNGVATTIVGITPRGFAFPLPGLGPVADVFSPYWITPEVEKTRGDSYNTTLVARLAPGVTLEQAKRGASEIARQLPQLHPDVYGAKHVTIADVFPLRDRATADSRRSLLVLFAAVGLVLLIACINVSSLLLARAATRQREISVRRALGASRSHLAMQFLAESSVLVMIGGVLGVAFATWGAKALAARAPQALLQGYQIGVDGRVLLFSVVIVAMTSVIVSLLPSLQRTDAGIADSLRGAGRAASDGVSKQRGRRTLVVSEIALASIVATGAGLMVKSLVNTQNVDPGFDSSGLVSFRLGLLNYRYRTTDEVTRFEQQMADRLRTLPGVRSASVATAIPMAGLFRISFSAEGNDLPKVPIGSTTIVFPDYFETLRIPIRAGRSFNQQDTRSTPPVAIVNEVLARQYYPGVNPVGRRIKWGSPASPSPWATIVGVSATAKTSSLDSPDEPALYFPAVQIDSSIVERMMRGMVYVVRTDGDPSTLFNAIRRTVKDADPELPIVGLRTVDEIITRSVAGRRFNTALLGGFALLAIVLAAVGIYGLMAYAVVQRTREIGIRLAVGATPVDVFRLVIGQATRTTVVGIAIGVVGALVMTRVMTTLLFDVSPFDPTTFIASSVLLLLIAAIATYLPARRAARIDPQSAIRMD
jgi:putative ABC transport system permease protein